MCTNIWEKSIRHTSVYYVTSSCKIQIQFSLRNIPHIFSPIGQVTQDRARQKLKRHRFTEGNGEDGRGKATGNLGKQDLRIYKNI